MLSVNDWSFAVPGGLLTALCLAFAFGGVVLWSLRRRRTPVLVALRVLSAVAAWLVAVQPVKVTPEEERLEGTLVVLLDDSRSMALHERGAPAEALRAEWAGRDNVQIRRFSASVQAASGPLGFNGGESAVLQSVASVRAEERVGAVLLLSDGAETGDGQLLSEGPPVHVVPLGPDAIRDDAIVDVQADPVGFLRQRSEVRVRIRRSGASGPLPLRLSLEDRVIAEQLVQFEDGVGEALFRFEPRRMGRAAYRLTLPLAEDDEVPVNNERDFLMQVNRDRLRILLVAGRPTWDVRFLREFLERDASVDLISFFILRTTSDLTVASPDEMALIPFPTDELFREHLGSFDLIVFQDFDYAPYDMAGYLPGIARYVERGGSFAMVGGDRSFGSGGYAGTPLADVLPVRFEDVDRPERGAILTPFQPEIVPDAAFHPLVRLDADGAENARAWATLEPLLGNNRLLGARAGSNVLLRRANMPVLVCAEHGEGRVLAFAADSSWRWGMATGGRSGDASHYDRFWDRAVRWLARDPALDAARVTTDRARYGPGETIRARFTARDPSYAPVQSAQLSVDESPAQDAPLDEFGEGGVELVAPETPGLHVLRLLAGEDELARESFVVEGSGQELADVRVQRARLARIAEQTGGEVFEADGIPDPDGIDTTRRRTVGITTVAPFGRWYAVVGVLLLLSASWIVRRRMGES